MKYLLCFLFISGFASAQTFTLTGVVKNAHSQELMPFANVFVSNTTHGTTTLENGQFTLKNLSNGTLIIGASFVGYQPFQKQIRVENGKDLYLEIFLIPLAEVLKEISVSVKKDKTWFKQYKRFEKAILGTSDFSDDCQIKNGYTIDFQEDGSTLSAKVNQALEVENRALGYRLFFNLLEFKLSPTQIRYQGFARFETLKPQNEKEDRLWQQNRQEAYLGSERHLLRSWVQKNSKKQGFELYIDKLGIAAGNRTPLFFPMVGKSVLPFLPDTLIGKGKLPTEYRFLYPHLIEVHFADKLLSGQFYRDDNRVISWIKLLRPLEFTNEGVVINPTALEVSGFMSQKRLAEMLPLDYQLDASYMAPAVDAPKSLDSLQKAYDLWRLQESIALTTAKPYYHASETLDIKGYLSYADPTLKDSLSTIVHIELFSPNGTRLSHKKCLIANASFAAQFALPTNETGTYFVRAYTHWQRNYGHNTATIMPVAVLGRSQIALWPKQNTPLHSSLTLTSSKTRTKPRELIEIYAQPEFQSDTLSPWLLTVLDTNTINGLPPIFSKHFLSPKEIQYKLNSLQWHHLAENGIQLSGAIVNNKGNVSKGNVLIMIPSLGVNQLVECNDIGRFKVDGLIFNDTLAVAVQALDTKGRPNGKVIFDEDEQLPFINPNQSFYQIAELPQPTTLDIPFIPPKDAILLAEVTIKTEKKTTDKALNRSLLGKPDQMLLGKEINESLWGSNPILALQGRMPGVQIVEYVDRGSGEKRYKIRIRGGQNTYSQSDTDVQPLILIDNVPVESVDALRAIPPQNIERVEVTKRANSFYGSRGANGIISFVTKSSFDTKSNPLNQYHLNSAQSINLIGISSTLPFSVPDYRSPTLFNNPKPDSRNLIFWLPESYFSFKNINKFSFFSADKPSIYRVLLRRILPNGMQESSEIFIQNK